MDELLKNDEEIQIALIGLRNAIIELARVTTLSFVTIAKVVEEDILRVVRASEEKIHDKTLVSRAIAELNKQVDNQPITSDDQNSFIKKLNNQRCQRWQRSRR